MKTKLLSCVISLTALAGLASAGAPPAAAPAPAAKAAPAPAAKAAPAPAAAKTPAPAAAAPKAEAKAATPAPSPAAAPAAPDMAAMMPKPGPETMALAFMAGNMTWTGKVMANAMGPGTPEMATKGSAKCKWVHAKLWVQCDVSDTWTAGKAKMTMTGTMLTGWDFMAKGYRGTWADSMGGAMFMAGKLEGTKFVLESKGDYSMMGQPMAFRITWDWADAKAPKMMQEVKMGAKGAWTLTTESVIKGMKVPAAAAAPVTAPVMPKG